MYYSKVSWDGIADGDGPPLMLDHSCFSAVDFLRAIKDSLQIRLPASSSSVKKNNKQVSPFVYFFGQAFTHPLVVCHPVICLMGEN